MLSIPFPSITTDGSLPPARVRRFPTKNIITQGVPPEVTPFLRLSLLCDQLIGSSRPQMQEPKCLLKKKHVLHQCLHQMFKIYIPTIHLLWTCLNTHYLYLSKVIPSITIIGSSCGTTSAPKKRNFPSSAQLQRRPSAPLEKIHHHLRNIYPHVTHRFQGRKYRTVMTGRLMF